MIYKDTVHKRDMVLYYKMEVINFNYILVLSKVVFFLYLIILFSKG